MNCWLAIEVCTQTRGDAASISIIYKYALSRDSRCRTLFRLLESRIEDADSDHGPVNLLGAR